MVGVNKAIILGYLGKDPEVRHLESGKAVATFSIATSEAFNNKQGNKITSTEWHNIVLWTPLAEIAEKYLKKGHQVYIEGKITTRSYNDKNGATKNITEVVGRDLTLLNNQNRKEEQTTAFVDVGGLAHVSKSPTVAPQTTTINDLPF